VPATPDGEQVGSHAGVTFVVRGSDCLDVLEPLWLHLFDFHLSTGNAGIRGIPRDQSWPRRRQLYEALFTEPNTFVVLAERDGVPVGYAFCHIRPNADDTWDTGDCLGEVETLVLSPEVRGGGVGSALMDAAEAELARRGARDVLTAVMAGNERTLQFYERRGMQPTVTYLMRLAPRDRSGD
jgi:ribosomal protein S18 acetylase RimI-like enzyme